MKNLERKKMTREEAIDWLKAINATQKDSIHKSSLLQRKESIHIAIEALEKQIPKNTEILDKVYDEVRSCPACGKDTVYHGRTFFCCKCGQALEWGE